MESERKRKRPLNLDWEKLLPRSEDDEPPAELLVTAAEKTKPVRSCDQNPPNDDLLGKSDQELNELIKRTRGNIPKVGPLLPDKGEKLKATLLRYEEEVERRRNCGQDDNGCKDQSQLGASCGIQKGAQMSKFAACFSTKLDEKGKDGRTVNAFEEEFSHIKPCGRRRMRPNGQSSERGRHKNVLSSRQIPFRHPSTLSVDVDKQIISNGDKEGSHSSTGSPRHSNKDIAGCFSETNTSEDPPSKNLRPRNAQAFVLVDEEEPELMETIQEEEKLDDCMKEITVYYPSRDDPESVEISYTDMECLAPKAYLSSTIMNFYIRYLQQPAFPSERARCDYHFFNTYFYLKLKEAVLTKSDKEASFAKFRRWWKGVNIFEKAYMLLPVHENQHWSLVIICIPDKEDGSWPILLHLDSLGLHFSKPIFANIKSFLIEEWNYLRKGEAPLNLPIADKVWQKLPRRMDEERILVPQQRNDYDCGLFVLFFMERFIEEAPERLKRTDLAMFGRQWFEPEEASGLRRKIRNLLVKEFQDAFRNANQK